MAKSQLSLSDGEWSMERSNLLSYDQQVFDVEQFTIQRTLLTLSDINTIPGHD